VVSRYLNVHGRPFSTWLCHTGLASPNKKTTKTKKSTPALFVTQISSDALTKLLNELIPDVPPTPFPALGLHVEGASSLLSAASHSARVPETTSALASINSLPSIPSPGDGDPRLPSLTRSEPLYTTSHSLLSDPSNLWESIDASMRLAGNLTGDLRFIRRDIMLNIHWCWRLYLHIESWVKKILGGEEAPDAPMQLRKLVQSVYAHFTNQGTRNQTLECNRLALFPMATSLTPKPFTFSGPWKKPEVVRQKALPLIMKAMTHWLDYPSEPDPYTDWALRGKFVDIILQLSNHHLLLLDETWEAFGRVRRNVLGRLSCDPITEADWEPLELALSAQFAGPDAASALSGLEAFAASCYIANHHALAEPGFIAPSPTGKLESPLTFHYTYASPAHQNGAEPLSQLLNSKLKQALGTFLSFLVQSAPLLTCTRDEATHHLQLPVTSSSFINALLNPLVNSSDPITTAVHQDLHLPFRHLAPSTVRLLTQLTPDSARTTLGFINAYILRAVTFGTRFPFTEGIWFPDHSDFARHVGLVRQRWGNLEPEEEASASQRDLCSMAAYSLTHTSSRNVSNAKVVWNSPPGWSQFMETSGDLVPWKEFKSFLQGATIPEMTASTSLAGYQMGMDFVAAGVVCAPTLAQVLQEALGTDSRLGVSAMSLLGLVSPRGMRPFPSWRSEAEGKFQRLFTNTKVALASLHPTIASLLDAPAFYYALCSYARFRTSLAHVAPQALDTLAPSVSEYIATLTEPL
jgi:hypothetical protein